VTLALQEKGVNADADNSNRESRAKVIPQMRDLHAPGDLSPQGFLGRALDRPPKLANVISYAS
jgi:hypothetical protein